MAFLVAYRVPSQETAGGSIEGRTFKAYYHAYTELGDGPDVARRGTGVGGVPQIGDTLSIGGTTDAARVVIASEANWIADVPPGDGTAGRPPASVEMNDAISLFAVTLTFSTVAVSGPSGFPTNPGGGSGDPLTVAPVFSYFAVSRQEPVHEGYVIDPPGAEGTLVPVENAAGQAYDPPVVDDVFDHGIRIVKNVSAVVLADMEMMQGAINSDENGGSDTFNTAYGCADGQARLEVSARNLYVEGSSFWEMTYEITFRLTDSGFHREFVERGTMARPNPAAAPQVITDDEGIPIDEPVYLDLTGVVTPGPAQTRTWKLGKTAGFDQFNIPSP